MLKLLVPIVALVSMVSCSSAPPALLVSDDALALQTFSDAEILSESKAILSEMGVDAGMNAKVAQRVGEMLADPEFSQRAREAGGVNAVIAVRGSGGGFVVRSGGSDGKASFAGGSQRVPVRTEGLTWGGSVGGGTVFGVALIIGLEHEEHLQDRYSVRIQGGSAATESYQFAYGESERNDHTAWFTGTGVGFGADAGYGSVDLYLNPE